MKYACYYAIVRFMPFVETGEFANVGIVLMCPHTGHFDFRLLNRVRRITAFFDQLEARVYREAKNDLRDELTRVKVMVNARKQREETRGLRYLFEELVRPREVILRFDRPRVVMADDPEGKIDELFNFYVQRDFVTPEYIEQRLETRVRGLLLEACVRECFHEEKVEHGAFHARFPFAHRNAAGILTKAIKPLHLGHKDPANAYEHGWAWIGKIRQLKKYDALPERVLIAAQGPDETNREGQVVYKEIQEDFKGLGIEVAPISEPAKIKEFALMTR